ncbi:hypothetical protein PCK2_000749 [Pneumocystis canis]|nr:hypothetical protein PCK2_000749 [Pneumocystis canis]
MMSSDAYNNELFIQISNGTYTSLGIIDGVVNVMTTIKDGKNLYIAIAGQFSAIGNVKTQNIVLYDLSKSVFVTLDKGIPNAIITSLYFDEVNKYIYIGGNFNWENSHNAIIWDLTKNAWVELPFRGFDGVVHAITQINKQNILFGGSFDNTILHLKESFSTLSDCKRQVLNLQTAFVSSEHSSSNEKYSNPRNVICSNAYTNKSSWILQDSRSGKLSAVFNFVFKPQTIRFRNSDVANYGTKIFRFISMPINGIMNLSYTDPVTGKQAFCEASCPLLQTSSEYQEFKFVNIIPMTGFRLELLSWYGKGAGLKEVEILLNDITTYAVNAFNEPFCVTKELRSNSYVTGGPWNVVKANGEMYLSANLSGEALKSSSVVFLPRIQNGGYYDIELSTPGCIPDNTCLFRGKVTIEIYYKENTKPATAVVYQTQYYGKIDTIYNGYIYPISSSFRPYVILRPTRGQEDLYTNNFLLAIYIHLEEEGKKVDMSSEVGLAWLDLSTGDFFTQKSKLEYLSDELERINPREIIIDKMFQEISKEYLSLYVKERGCTVTYDIPRISDPITQKWENIKTSDKEILNFSFLEENAALGILSYVDDKLQGEEFSLQTPIRRNAEENTFIDINSIRALELKQSLMEGGRRGSLLSAIKRTVTSSGERILSWYCDIQLREYCSVFRGNDEAASLDNISRRYAWIKRILKLYDEKHSKMFPESWNTDKRLCQSFCINTRQLIYVLSKSGKNNKITVLLEALKKTLEFEQFLESRFIFNNSDSLDTIISKYDNKKIIFHRIIRNAFDPYLNLFIESQENILSGMIRSFKKIDLENEIKDKTQLIVTSSSTELFLSYRKTLEQYEKLFNGQLLLELSHVFGKWLIVYAETILLPVVDGKHALNIDICCFMIQEISSLPLKKKNGHMFVNAAQNMELWSQKILEKLYTHMDISSDEQVMIEKLSKHGIMISDMAFVLIVPRQIENSADIKPENNNHSENIESSFFVSNLDTAANSLKASNKVLKLDARWAALCNLFLLLVIDSVYDSRSRVFLQRVGKAISISSLEITMFEKRITDELIIQENCGISENGKSVLNPRNNLSRNKRCMLMALATVSGGLVIGLSSGILAPLIGAGLGTAFTTIGVAGTTGFLAGSGGTALITTGGVITGSSIAVKKIPISEVGAEQMILDLYSIKLILLKLPVIASKKTTQAHISYTKFVNKGISRIETILKVLLTQINSSEEFVKNYFIWIGDRSTSNFLKVLELKGIRKQEQNQLLDTFNIQALQHADLIDSSPLLESLVLSQSFGPNIGLSSRFDASNIGTTIFSTTRKSFERLPRNSTTNSETLSLSNSRLNERFKGLFRRESFVNTSPSNKESRFIKSNYVS